MYYKRASALQPAHPPKWASLIPSSPSVRFLKPNKITANDGYTRPKTVSLVTRTEHKIISLAFYACLGDFFLLAFFYTSTKSWRGYIFITVSVCVCVFVCLSVGPFVNKMSIEPMHRFGAVFAK